jgi:hypothetical protein
VAGSTRACAGLLSPPLELTRQSGRLHNPAEASSWEARVIKGCDWLYRLTTGFQGGNESKAWRFVR